MSIYIESVHYTCNQLCDLENDLMKHSVIKYKWIKYKEIVILIKLCLDLDHKF
jgi:hypothetical protein